MRGADPIRDPTQFDPDRIRVVLDRGEVVELDGGTLVLDGEESPSVVLRLASWRARSVARVLQRVEHTLHIRPASKMLITVRLWEPVAYLVHSLARFDESRVTAEDPEKWYQFREVWQ